MHFFDLNSDIVLQIFLHFVATDSSGPFLLTLVCTEWRDWVISRPILWTWIIVDDLQPHWTERATVCLALSRDSPLRVVFQVSHVDPPTIKDIAPRCVGVFIEASEMYQEFPAAAQPDAFRRQGIYKIHQKTFKDMTDMATIFLSQVPPGQLQTLVLDLTPCDHRHWRSLFGNSRDVLKLRFQPISNFPELSEGLLSLQNSVKRTLDDRYDTLSTPFTFGGAFSAHFRRSGLIADAGDVILILQRVVELTPVGRFEKPTMFSNLGQAFLYHFEQLGGVGNMSNAISTMEKAVQLMPDDHPEKPKLFCNLGGLLQLRFRQIDDLTDLEYSVSQFTQGVALTPDLHPDKPSHFNGLGCVRQLRYYRLGNMEDLENGISDLRWAVELTPDHHHQKPQFLSDLGSALRQRFERLGSLEDMEDAITFQQKAVELTPDNHPQRPKRLGRLSSALLQRFERLGSLEDMEDAITFQQKAVELTPDGHPHRPKLQDRLGSALRQRFEWLGTLEDVENAIELQQKAVELTPNGHPHKPTRLSRLGGALRRHFERLHEMKFIDDAIEVQQKAIQLTTDDHPDKPGLLCDLGNALERRFRRLGHVKDIEDAIELQQKAVELTPDGHPDRPGLLSNLGRTSQQRSEKLNRVTDLEGVIKLQQRAVELIPDGHPHKAVILNNIGSAFLNRFEHAGDPDDLERALSALSTAANSTTAAAIVRFNAARLLAKAAEENSRPSLGAYSCAVSLLPQIAWLGLVVSDQHALLTDAGGLVRDAVATAIKNEEYETAVVWAEQGRSIVWQNLLNLRNPADDLRESHPELVKQLHSIALQLEESSIYHRGQNEMRLAPNLGVSRRHSKLALEWEITVKEIRKISGFEDFLKAKTFSQLSPAAHEGPVVILNVSPARCDALVLTAGDSDERLVSIFNIELERFSYYKGMELFRVLKRISHPDKSHRGMWRIKGMDSERRFKAILRILWEDVVKPVIKGLAFPIQPRRPPRIWWCPTGFLSFLPIHAAGVYDTQEAGEKVSDYVVSSYTPTLTAILNSLDPPVQDDFRIMVVSDTLAPGEPPTPYAEDEVAIVQRLTAGAHIRNLNGVRATVGSVMKSMMESDWIHIACAGNQDHEDPMDSSFILHDAPLKLSGIIKLSSPRADFAFLSSCDTAMGEEMLPEESVHMAAGMLLLGCRGVIATKWFIHDEDGPQIAEDVYSRIFKDGKPNRKEAAYALHEAVKRLRSSGASYMSWATFVHIGR